MTNADRWLLPDGVEEVLPAEAQQIENLRRRLLDLFSRWGYQLVIPPLVEYTESLLIGLGRDLDLLTFKMTDQLSGRTLGVRADMTPQTARMDAHSMARSGVNRLCYAGHVLHTKPKTPLETRSPFVTGLELYGEADLGADVEVISILLESLQGAGLQEIAIEIGHVGIFRALVDAAGLGAEQQDALFDLMQRKAVTEIKDWVAANVADKQLAATLLQLPRLAGDRQDLAKTLHTLRSAPAAVLEALAELESLADLLSGRYPSARFYFDLSELPSFRYHTGIVFAAFTPGYGRAIAAGGRYDHVGEVFGRARAATGFNINLSSLHKLVSASGGTIAGIYAAASDDPRQWQEVQRLREHGEIVVQGFAGVTPQRDELGCDRQLELVDGHYQVKPWRD